MKYRQKDGSEVSVVESASSAFGTTLWYAERRPVKLGVLRYYSKGPLAICFLRRAEAEDRLRKYAEAHGWHLVED